MSSRAAATPQQSQTRQSLATTANPVLPVRANPQMPTQVGLVGSPTATPGFVFIEDGDPQFIGYGFSFDEASGDWVVKKPVADFVLPNHLDPAYPLKSMDTVFEVFTTENESIKKGQLNFSASGAIGAVKLSGSMEAYVNSTASSINSAFSVGFHAEYETLVPNLADHTSYKLTPEAINTLRTPGLDWVQWQSKFGNYVAIGCAVYGKAALKVSLTDTTSATTKKIFAQMEGSYGPYEGSVNFSSYAKSVFETSGLKLELDWYGSAAPSITLPLSVDDPAIDTLATDLYNEVVAKGRARKGLLLIPMDAFPNAPLSPLDQWDGTLLSEAGLQAYLSVQSVLDSQTWISPVSVQRFLEIYSDVTFPVGYTGPQTSWDLLRNLRLELVNDLDALWTAMKTYLPDPTNVNRDALLLAMAQVDQSRPPLDALLYDLSRIKFSTQVPDIRVTLEEQSLLGHYNWSDSSGMPAMMQTIVLKIENLAWFGDESYSDLYQWLQLTRDVDSYLGTLSMVHFGDEQAKLDDLTYDSVLPLMYHLMWGETPISPVGQKLYSTVPALSSPLILSLTNNPATGLHDVRVRFSAVTQKNWEELLIQVADDLDRLNFFAIDDNNIPPVSGPVSPSTPPQYKPDAGGVVLPAF
jgi:hypothetical protein